MILVDTSAWIDFFRGVPPLAERVDALLDSNELALCGPVITRDRDFELMRQMGMPLQLA